MVSLRVFSFITECAVMTGAGGRSKGALVTTLKKGQGVCDALLFI